MGAPLLLILDFDGTLAPIVGRPEAARLAPSARRTLRRLAAHPRVRLAVLSGRALADLRRRVGLTGVVYGGCHGLELQGPGLRFRHPAAASVRSRLRVVAAALEAARPRFPGIRLEPKGLALAVHSRRVPLSRMAALRRLVQRLGRISGLAIIPGKRVWDLVPSRHPGKSAAVRFVRKHARSPAGRSLLTVYAGDDATDAEVFRRLGRRIVGVQVGARRGPAAYRLRSVSDVHAWLRRIAALLAADRPSARPTRSDAGAERGSRGGAG